MTAVNELSMKLLTRRPPSPIPMPPLVYYEGYSNQPRMISDPRPRHIRTDTAMEGFFIRTAPEDAKEPEEEPFAEDPAGLADVPEVPEEEPFAEDPPAGLDEVPEAIATKEEDDDEIEFIGEFQAEKPTQKRERIEVSNYINYLLYSIYRFRHMFCGTQ